MRVSVVVPVYNEEETNPLPLTVLYDTTTIKAKGRACVQALGW